MKYQDESTSFRDIYIQITPGELIDIIQRAMAKETGLSLGEIQAHGKVEIKPMNVDQGYKASFNAHIPLGPKTVNKSTSRESVYLSKEDKA